ncbi:MAG: hypothetical protein ACE5M4_11860, partial [Anaerolineales bacterium]
MKRTVLLVGFVFAASACALDQPTLSPVKPSPTFTPQPTITATLTGTPTPSPSFTPEPTHTQTPKPTNTPFPQVAFSDQPTDNYYLVPLTVQRLTPFEAMVHFELERPSLGWLLYRPIQADV